MLRIYLSLSIIASYSLGKGMAYIHGAQIIHRDLKCSNLLVTKDWNIKGIHLEEFTISVPHILLVSDFGLSRFVSDAGNTMTACGTPSWAAPEVLRNSNYSFKADVYRFCLHSFLSIFLTDFKFCNLSLGDVDQKTSIRGTTSLQRCN